jgi:acetylornithine deacetylase
MTHPSLPSTLALLDRLVAFDTSSANTNLPLIEYVRNYLERYGVASTLVFNADSTKANLFATIGPQDTSGICLSGHTDVVPASGQPWTVPPFALTHAGDRVLGRGTADMKGFLAVALASVPSFLSMCTVRPMHLAFSYDEEIGCVGVRGLLAQLADSPIRPLACVVGEPTSMKVGIAHKGKRAYRCCVRGLAGHSSDPEKGVNAVDYAAELVVRLRRTASALKSDGLRDDRFEPPYTTIHTGRMEGGIALNVIPDGAKVEFEIRSLPGEDTGAIVDTVQSFIRSELLPEMQAKSASSGIEWHGLVDYPPLIERDVDEWLRSLVCEAAGDTSLRTLSYGTEAGLFQQIGIPSIVCGPGSIERAHKADEYVEVEQLGRCLSFVESLCKSAQML